MWFSGSDIYHPLNISDINGTMANIQDDELKFLIHGYTDRVQFNRTGKIKNYFQLVLFKFFVVFPFAIWV